MHAYMDVSIRAKHNYMDNGMDPLHFITASRWAKMELITTI